MTPAARSVIEAVHAGSVLAMHYRRDESGESLPRFVLEPKGKVVFAPTAILAVRSGHLKAADDGIPGLAVTQTWTAGNPLPPEVKKPPFIAGSNVRDTTVPGLTVRFRKSGEGSVFHISSGKLLLEQPAGRVVKIRKRDFVDRVNTSRLAEIDWSLLTEQNVKRGEHVGLGRDASRQIWGEG